MDHLPPLILRRLVVAPVVLVLCLLLLVAAPLILAVAAVLDLALPGHWRTLRLTAYLEWSVLFEVIGLVGMFVLWVASGFGVWMRSGRIQRAHYAAWRGWVRGLGAGTRVLFGLRVVIEDRPDPRSGPVLVFSRHAGPGNSMLLVGTLLVEYRRNPRIVMLAKLQWDPLFDSMLNRLPNEFIQHDKSKRDSQLKAIGELASGLGDRDALVLFPEGKDFTFRQRVKAIDLLRRKGHVREARKAEQMPHMLPPRHGGVMAAITNAPEADVVFVAHALLEEVGSFGDVWRSIPLRRPVVSRYWRIPAANIPTDTDELIEWLYEWWATIDQWIADRAALTSGPVDATTPG
ncbi:MAG: 1-acyl-sn-glycerol-3-phosphate acyltransferase [Mycobacteriales bacterium]